MRRITIWLVSTVAVLVLLFSYRTSTMGSGFADTSAEAAGVPAKDPTAGASAGPAPTGDAGQSTAPATGGGDGGADDPTAAATPSGGAGHGSGATSAPGKASSGTYDGSVVQTRFGPVQVRITVSGGKLTDVQALQVPNNNHHDVEINSYAVPILRDEALAAQSAQIDTVSGATYTSDGYRESLQAALDAAHFG